jgi:hypothetical protein
MNAALGQLVFAVHLVVIAFNVAGLVVIPLGARLGWSFVRWRWLRLLHLGSWLVVAAQALLGRACFLTDWQAALTGQGAHDPLIMRWINSLVYWRLPTWAFAAIYVALFAYVVALWRLVPVNPRPSSGRR